MDTRSSSQACRGRRTLIGSLVGAVLVLACVGLPDRATVNVGHGWGDIEGLKADFDTEGSWVEAGLEFPLGQEVQPRRRDPSPPLPLDDEPRVRPPVEEAAAAEPPWWEDFGLVQTLVLLVLSYAAGELRRPAQEKLTGKSKRP